MNTTDEIDRAWRDALHTTAAFQDAPTEPARRVEARVRRRRRRHTATTSLIALVAVVAVATGTGLLLRNGSHTRAEERPTRPAVTAPTVVEVTDAPGGALRIAFPGRAVTGDPQQVTLPAGDIRFEIVDDFGGHALVIDGVPGFNAVFANPGSVTQTVHLDPAVYRLHCTIPGHAEAGEEMLLVVR